jgi:hypothetical protein
VGGAPAGHGEGDVDVRVEDPGGDVERGQAAAGHARRGGEGAADVEAVARDHHVANTTTGAGLPLGVELTGADVDLGQLLGRRAVHGGELPADDHRRAVGVGGHHVDRAVEAGEEGGRQGASGGVEGEEVRPRLGRTAGGAHGGEGAAHHHAPAHLDDRQDPAVQDLGGPVGGVGGDDDRLGRVDRPGLGDGTGDEADAEERGGREGTPTDAESGGGRHDNHAP